VPSGRWIKVAQQADLWLSVCHADDAPSVAEVCLIGGEYQIKRGCHGWRKETRLVGASQAAGAQDGGAVRMHPLAGMLI
jgi:hypothetical protein